MHCSQGKQQPGHFLLISGKHHRQCITNPPPQLELDVVIDLIHFVEAQQALSVLQVPKPQSKLSTLANEMGLLVESKRRQLQGVSTNVKAHLRLLERLRGLCSGYVQLVASLQVGAAWDACCCLGAASWCAVALCCHKGLCVLENDKVGACQHCALLQ